MGFKHVTLRHRLFHAIKHEAEETKHRHLHEYVHEMLFVLTNVMFLAGSFCFIEHVGYSEQVAVVGDWLFIVGAFMQLSLVAQSLHEQIMAKKHLSARFSERDRDEIVETCLVLIACFVFWLGSVCFMPGLYKTDELERVGHEIGAWSFITGSMGLVVASYYNALGIAAERAKHPEDHAKEQIVYYVQCWALCLAQLGGVAFACGSFLYRPQFQNCLYHTPSRRKELAREVREVEAAFDTAMNSGTVLYIIGSSLFVVQSILCLLAGILKHAKDVESSSDDEKDSFAHAKRAGRKSLQRSATYGSTPQV